MGQQLFIFWGAGKGITLLSHQKIEMEWDRKESSWGLLVAGEKLCLVFVLCECGKAEGKEKLLFHA